MVDTSILVEILRRNPKILNVFQQLGTQPLFSTEITLWSYYLA